MSTQSTLRSILALSALSAPLFAQTALNLSPVQSPFKNQGSRRSCICFSAIAALEAAYRRAGYGTLDLSEEFADNVLNKQFWIHPNWNNANGPAPVLSTAGADRSENQLATTGGGVGALVLEALSTGAAVPAESDMPYVPYNRSLKPHADYTHVHWRSQRNSNTWNLDHSILPRKALTAPLYYRGKGFVRMSKPNDATQIEAVLRKGREVVIDFYTGGYMRNGVWTRKTESLSGLDSHSMLVVGYDRRSANPKDWFFICKNSWGATHAMPNGYTHISYEYLERYVSSGAYVTGVQAPRAWPELAAVGRWNLAFDGHRGTLDIYHIPGTAEHSMGHLKVVDRRLGTFYDKNGVAHRVNGQINGNRVEFWFKGSQPNMRWDEQRQTPTLGRRFIYYITDPASGEMSGWHEDRVGTTNNPRWGGYARVPATINGEEGFLDPVFNNAQPVQPEMYGGLWELRSEDLRMQVNIVRRNDALLSATQRSTYAGFEAVAIDHNGGRRSFVAMVERARPAVLKMDFSHPTRGRVQLEGYMLSHQRGVAAGHGTHGSPQIRSGFLIHRLGSSTTPGVKTTYGRACRGRAGLPQHQIQGVATLGQKISFDLHRAAPSRLAFLAIGNQTRKLDLAILGAPGCHLYNNNLITLGLKTNVNGSVGLPASIPTQQSLLGFFMASQFGVADPGANAAGLVTSNGMTLKLGGVR